MLIIYPKSTSTVRYDRGRSTVEDCLISDRKSKVMVMCDVIATIGSRVRINGCDLVANRKPKRLRFGGRRNADVPTCDIAIDRGSMKQYHRYAIIGDRRYWHFGDQSSTVGRLESVDPKIYGSGCNVFEV